MSACSRLSVRLFPCPFNCPCVRVPPQLDLDLTVSGVATLEGAIRRFVCPEELTGDNQVSCEPCGKKVDATKGLTLRSLPPVLSIQLKRYGLVAVCVCRFMSM